VEAADPRDERAGVTEAGTLVPVESGG
jgi:hypothetical protein